MLVHPWDAPIDDQEWRQVLRSLDFGQLIAPGGPDRELPVVVPTHFVYDGERIVELHLARPNPIWQALEERPRALLTVIGDYVYVPAALNAGRDGDAVHGVPTSYYAAVQVEADVQVVDDPVAKAAILDRQLARFEPAGSRRAPVDPHGGPDRRQLPGIRGLRLTVTGVRAKFKYGGNKSVEHRLDIAEALATRGGPLDAGARRRLLERLPADAASRANAASPADQASPGASRSSDDDAPGDRRP